MIQCQELMKLLLDRWIISHHFTSQSFEHVVLCVLLLFEDRVEEAPAGEGVRRFRLEQVEYHFRFRLGHGYECRAWRKHSRLDCLLRVKPRHVTTFEWSFRPLHVCKAITLNLNRMKLCERLHLNSVRFQNIDHCGPLRGHDVVQRRRYCFGDS